jgi:hypothetical protein
MTATPKKKHRLRRLFVLALAAGAAAGVRSWRLATNGQPAPPH